MGVKYCDTRVCLSVCLFVCLSVCPLAHFKNHMSQFYHIFWIQFRFFSHHFREPITDRSMLIHTHSHCRTPTDKRHPTRSNKDQSSDMAAARAVHRALGIATGVRRVQETPASDIQEPQDKASTDTKDKVADSIPYVSILKVAVRRSGNGVRRINEVTLRRVRLVLTSATFRGYTVLVCNQ